MVRLPAIGKPGLDTEMNGLVGWVRVEQVCYPGPGDNDACLTVPGGQDAQSACLQMECGRITPAGQRVHDDGDLEFGALQAVGGVNSDHRRGGRGDPCQGLADLVRLIAVPNSDPDVLGA